ncbi:MAG: aminoacyl-tRNA hydrolase, partial [Dietzia sp.]
MSTADAPGPRLVVGLANPGPDYEGTRHNIGWDVLVELASRALP